MSPVELHIILLQLLCAGIVFHLSLRFSSLGYLTNVILIFLVTLALLDTGKKQIGLVQISLFFLVPNLLLNTILYGFSKTSAKIILPKKYQVGFLLEEGNVEVGNVRRGVSVIGAAGSGKTESVIYNFMKHFRQHSFCGIIHDYKNFELTEIAVSYTHLTLPTKRIV